MSLTVQRFYVSMGGKGGMLETPEPHTPLPLASTREYIQILAQRYWDRECHEGPRNFDVLAPEEAAYPHMVILQLGRDYEEAFEGQMESADTFRLDFRMEGDNVDGAEAVRQGIMRELRRGGRLVRAGSIIDLTEAQLTVFSRQGPDDPAGTASALTGERDVFRRVQEVEILI